ncbi:MAG: hypothetical protein NUV34_10050 [Sulfuricaulis sp.]|nr:hypothetical protein [Sulfuricaulis sp.]
MIKRMILWLASAELANAAANGYAQGLNVGRAIGQQEMINHLRGDTGEPVTAEAMAVRAAGMVH